MIRALLLGIVVAGAAFALALGVVWFRWVARDRRRRIERLRVRRRDEELERARLALLLADELRADSVDAPPSLSPASSSARPGRLQRWAAETTARYALLDHEGGA